MERAFRTTLLAVAAALFAALWLFATPAGVAPLLAADGCDPGRPHEWGDFAETMTSGGLEREYLVHVPPTYDGSAAMPLVLLFHGLGGDSAQQFNYTGLPLTANRDGFLLVAPQGYKSASIAALTHWNVVQSDLPGEPNDIVFISDLLDEVSAELCVDQARIYAAGFSNGAQMTSRLACSLETPFAAIATVAGLYFPPLAAELQERACEPVRSVPIIAFHGTDDPLILFDGGRPTLAGFAIPLTFRDVEDEILPDWIANQACDTEPERTPVAEGIEVARYTGCRDGSTIELYVIEGAGHTWPDARTEPIPLTLGKTNRDINANDVIWEFFQEHPLDEESGGGLAMAWYVAFVAAPMVAAIGITGVWYARRRNGQGRG